MFVCVYICIINALLHCGSVQTCRAQQVMGPVCSIRLLLVGMENSGKTTLLYRLKFGQYLHTKPTIGFNSEKVSGFTKKTKGVTFYMWDVEGKDNARPLWKSYLRSVLLR